MNGRRQAKLGVHVQGRMPELLLLELGPDHGPVLQHRLGLHALGLVQLHLVRLLLHLYLIPHLRLERASLSPRGLGTKCEDEAGSSHGEQRPV
jgi:hypothetical protein